MSKLPAWLGPLALVPAQLALAAEDGWVEASVEPPPVEMPIEGVDTHGRTQFHLVSRFSPGSGAHVWQFHPALAFQLFPGLGLTVAVPLAVLAPQIAGTTDHVSMGNVRLGVVGGFGIRLKSASEDTDAIQLRLGGGLDLYAPSAPLPTDERVAAVAAGSYHLLDPALWAPRGAGFRARLAVGVESTSWGVTGELGVTPSFAVDGSEVATTVWISPALRAHIVLFGVVEPFLELGAAVVAAEPAARALLDGALSPSVSGFQLAPGVRFHVGPIDPAILFYVQPEHGGSAFSVAIDLAGAVRRSVRARESRDIDRMPVGQ